MEAALEVIVAVRGMVLLEQSTMKRPAADTILSLLESVIPDEHLTPRTPRPGQWKFVRMRQRGEMARRKGVPAEDCPYRDLKHIEGAYRRAWLKGWHDEDLFQRRAHANDLYTCRMLTMRRPHGRTLNP